MKTEQHTTTEKKDCKDTKMPDLGKDNKDCKDKMQEKGKDTRDKIPDVKGKSDNKDKDHKGNK